MQRQIVAWQAVYRKQSFPKLTIIDYKMSGTIESHARLSAITLIDSEIAARDVKGADDITDIM